MLENERTGRAIERRTARPSAEVRSTTRIHTNCTVCGRCHSGCRNCFLFAASILSRSHFPAARILLYSRRSEWLSFPWQAMQPSATEYYFNFNSNSKIIQEIESVRNRKFRPHFIFSFVVKSQMFPPNTFHTSPSISLFYLILNYIIV